MTNLHIVRKTEEDTRPVAAIAVVCEEKEAIRLAQAVMEAQYPNRRIEWIYARGGGATASFISGLRVVRDLFHHKFEPGSQNIHLLVHPGCGEGNPKDKNAQALSFMRWLLRIPVILTPGARVHVQRTLTEGGYQNVPDRRK